jgi:hypothetical protein
MAKKRNTTRDHDHPALNHCLEGEDGPNHVDSNGAYWFWRFDLDTGVLYQGSHLDDVPGRRGVPDEDELP